MKKGNASKKDSRESWNEPFLEAVQLVKSKMVESISETPDLSPDARVPDTLIYIKTLRLTLDNIRRQVLCSDTPDKSYAAFKSDVALLAALCIRILMRQ
jgi:hypothetical protein